MATLLLLALGSSGIVLVHELGHAAVGLWVSDAPVVVSVGRTPPLVRLRAGRLAVAFHPLPPDRGIQGWARTFARLEPGDLCAYALAGPFANLALALAFVPFALRPNGHVSWPPALLAACSLATGLGNLVPRTRGGHRSDGLVALEAVRRRRRRLRR